jgi:hypothetical protein
MNDSHEENGSSRRKFMKGASAMAAFSGLGISSSRAEAASPPLMTFPCCT